MTFRHAAALLLVGWYLLMYPPWNVKKKAPDPDLPLNRWYQVEAFDSLEHCEANKVTILGEMDKKTRTLDRDKANAQQRIRHLARCVSADDPRLKQST